jgi:hypothetical protein
VYVHPCILLCISLSNICENGAKNSIIWTLERLTLCVLMCCIAGADPLYVDRAKVVNGELEPSAAASEAGEAEPGIPEFWLNVLRADETVGGLVRLFAHFDPVKRATTCQSMGMEAVLQAGVPVCRSAMGPSYFWVIILADCASVFGKVAGLLIVWMSPVAL